jgi:hypothetical protein
MIRSGNDSKVLQLAPLASAAERLPYSIELWNLPRTAPEKIIGQAASMVLARAIFAAAETEHLGRRLILRRGDRVLQESG